MFVRLLHAKGIRLAGSGLSYKGRLEISINGHWGTVCDYSFGNNDAKVACYMLGLGYVCLKVDDFSKFLKCF